MKDNFSEQPDNYARYRPGYPQEMFTYLYSLLNDNQTAWDVGTGNGQVALELSRYFKKVYATDISQAQLDQAHQRENITYSLQPAEKTDFEDDLFDLCFVAQAIHWFDFKKFYKEINRTAKDNSIIAVIGYGLIKINEELDHIISSFYYDVIGHYWDPERKYIDENYGTIPFPFAPIHPPPFQNLLYWTFEHLIGYLRTWSAVQHYSQVKGADPIEIIHPTLKKIWGGELTRQVNFPLLLRIGRINKT